MNYNLDRICYYISAIKTCMSPNKSNSDNKQSAQSVTKKFNISDSLNARAKYTYFFDELKTSDIHHFNLMFYRGKHYISEFQYTKTNAIYSDNMSESMGSVARNNLSPRLKKEFIHELNPTIFDLRRISSRAKIEDFTPEELRAITEYFRECMIKLGIYLKDSETKSSSR